MQLGLSGLGFQQIRSDPLTVDTILPTGLFTFAFPGNSDKVQPYPCRRRLHFLIRLISYPGINCAELAE